MDTVRTNRSKKRSWLIAGSLMAVLFLIFVVVCVSLFGSDSTEAVVDDGSEKVKSVPEAFKYIEKKVEKSLESAEEKDEVMDTLKKAKERIALVTDLEKAAKSTEKSTGGNVSIKITEATTKTDRPASARSARRVVRPELGKRPASAPPTVEETEGLVRTEGPKGDEEDFYSVPDEKLTTTGEPEGVKPTETVVEPEETVAESSEKKEGIVIEARIPNSTPSKKETTETRTEDQSRNLQGTTA